MAILEQVPSRLFAFATDVLRLSVWLLLIVVVFGTLERIFPVRRQRVFRKSFFVDLVYYFLNGLLPKMLLVVPMACMAWGLHYMVSPAVHARTAEMPLWARLAAALVAGEFGFYWGHRWMHEIPFLWRFHAIHHSSEELDWMVNTRAHPFDIVFVRLCGFVPMYALGLAGPMMGQTADLIPLLVMLVGTLWGFFIHANLRWRFGWLGLVISTPAFHHWHHTNDEHVNKNYASMLPLMDRLFGTCYMPEKQWPDTYGISGTVAPGLAGQLIGAFLGEDEGRRDPLARERPLAKEGKFDSA